MIKLFLFQIKESLKLGTLFKIYADRKGVEKKTLRFFFDGQRINDSDTAKCLSMMEDSNIDVYMEQIGG